MAAAPRKSRRVEERIRVAILTETSSQWSRHIIDGINRYIREHEDWHVFIEPRGSNEIIALPPRWKGDGVIANIRDIETAAHLKRHNLPVVNTCPLALPSRFQFSQITTDKAACCKMAAKYFFDLGFRQFGYLNLIENAHDRETRFLFTGEVVKLGGHCRIYEVKKHGWGTPDWNLSVRGLAAWLKDLPKPVALFSCAVGREVVAACKEGGLRMPEEVSLLLLNYDEIFGGMGHMPISGLIHACGAIGYEAASQLSGMMSGREPANVSRYFAPIGVETRRSSDTTAVADPLVAEAVHYIKEHACQGLQVNELARHSGVSRRVLERRFHSHLGAAPAEIIRNVRMERAKELLRTTSRPIPDIAEASGFGTSQYLATNFQQKLGVSPLKYRRQFHGVPTP
ncbi:MAG: helix-turn-helix domain-containing protein [Terrimicrobiaceae bacterium]